MRPRVSRRLAASAVVTAARATVLRSARLLSFAGAATREQRAVEVIANMMIDASVLMTNAPIPRRGFFCAFIPEARFRARSS